MKVWEMEEGKEYGYKGLKYAKNIDGDLFIYDERKGWRKSILLYNEAHNMNFEEIEQPMTFTEVVEWMEQGNVAIYEGRQYGIPDDFGHILHLETWGTPEVTYEMVKGEWCKED